MCKYASFVLTKDKVFWSKKTESHEEIIREFNLCETDSSKTRINILRVEISPNKTWGDLSKWAYEVDQDLRPEWFDAAECEARTRKELRKKVDPKLLKNFKLLDEFLVEVNTTKWLKQHGKRLKTWKYFEADNLAAARDAARDAAWAAAWDAVGDAARDAAWDDAWYAAGAAAWDAVGDAARDAARDAAWDDAWYAAGAAAWDAVGDAARDAAWYAAGAAAWDAVGDAARDAAWDDAWYAAGAAAWDAVGDAAWDDAWLKASAIIGTGLKIDPKHIKHINDRWEVWKRGYALLCDVNGELYVYGKK